MRYIYQRGLSLLLFLTLARSYAFKSQYFAMTESHKKPSSFGRFFFHYRLRDMLQRIDQFRYIQIQLETVDLTKRLWGRNTEFVGFIPQSLVLRSIVLG